MKKKAGFRNSLVMSDGETIVIGTVDEIQKLHIRTVSLGESVRRVVHQPETSTMAILVSRPLVSEFSSDVLLGVPTGMELFRILIDILSQKWRRPNLRAKRVPV